MSLFFFCVGSWGVACVEEFERERERECVCVCVCVSMCMCVYAWCKPGGGGAGEGGVVVLTSEKSNTTGILSSVSILVLSLFQEQ